MIRFESQQRKIDESKQKYCKLFNSIGLIMKVSLMSDLDTQVFSMSHYLLKELQFSKRTSLSILKLSNSSEIKKEIRWRKSRKFKMKRLKQFIKNNSYITSWRSQSLVEVLPQLLKSFDLEWWLGRSSSEKEEQMMIRVIELRMTLLSKHWICMTRMEIYSQRRRNLENIAGNSME